ncbi:FliM/FliN family flagellar motor C-terminal domain-containing protein [Photorhabdus heterorhabditis]|uniref:FliM/FliN family flagellar motor switch protein n=1 Tax=Photorhabdus heterorhabditis TaxID=880156 RepID=A0A5B0XAK8_9GAMM|nr:FliM/FliN family flagellar motor C-terminal domain-containing protein [Photorhabdus heterorhabditis]KAA1195497.1 FliM/FliN family flagellar motor switch protein [Photorhabdus heterorhabditis]KOY62994.1 type III secretion protein [Photorhabdus heterorhabditis]MBS9441040.1 FliM/FliN family flagellar motor switch protein [Photorhabdus heterorhabditis]
MRVKLDVVVANCSMTLDELIHLQKGQVKSLTNFVQSEVILKSGNEVIATGILVKIDEQFCVAIDQVNQIAE